MATKANRKAAKHGEKTLEIRIRLHTNDIAPKGQIARKHAQTGGFVFMPKNETHGIEGGKSKAFNTLLELPGVIEKVLIQNGVKLYLTPKSRKYIVPSN